MAVRHRRSIQAINPSLANTPSLPATVYAIDCSCDLFRPKRAFGVARSTNVPVEKPRITAKPRKVLASAPPPPQPPTGTRKIRPVCIQEPKTAAVTKTSRKDEHQEAVGTPTSSAKPAVAGTPYLSALNCSKCKLDQLESSTYWLVQISLAESTGKHFVSAAFFRLALECHAQPLQRLRMELRNYVTRHQVNSMESVWVDLSRAYGLAKGGLDSDLCDLIQHNSLLAEMNGSMDEPDAELCNLDQGHVSLAGKDGCSEHDDVDGKAVDKSLHDAAEAKANYDDEEKSGNMEPIDSASIDTLTGNKCGDGTSICCSSNKRVSSSPGKIETAKSCLSTGKDMVVGSVVTQEMSKASANNAARSNHGIGRRNRSCRDTGKNRENDT
ncbi:hypothetical protein MUK42_03722 [Musa troglodytarum]|uniref:Uncharacterized protein n=1 Tax=Musa troglodytarum TaxID=320322 RepID=A0A9E7G4M6_9LILI|nr:hypothetical protein MUK42_03722 [Musa troglodytarum]